ncbi:MAG: Rpn family recombination-promoting nuclease/putative transposase [Chloracidobacterium sp.]|nr:Rpn family recombination-promoting nuclease/putative transposase [Chloracidobacterium sp.]MDW8218341.1 Rpn family recombination-promoting nuclease/putative transposase [Acidobacteriota bacterium]
MPDTRLANPHDLFFKDLLARPGVAADFLAHYLPAEVLAHLDVSQPETVPGSFVDEDLREHLSDVLFRVRDRGGDEAFVYVLLEHKSTPWPWTPLQIGRYVFAIWEQARRAGGARLPVVLPVVFYHGKACWNVAEDVAGLVAHRDEPTLRAWTPSCRYWLCDLSPYSAEDLKGGLLLRVGLSVLRYVFSEDLPERLREIFRLMALLERQSVTEYLGTVLRYLAATETPLRWQTVKAVFKETIAEQAEELMTAPFVMEILQEGIEQGIEQGIERGIERGERLLVLRLLRRRFGALAPETEAAIEALPLERLEALGDALLDFQTPDDLRAWLNASAAS